MLSALLTVGSTEFTRAMWGKPVEAKAPVVEAPIETQKTNNAKTEQIAKQSTDLQSNSQKYADSSKQVNQQSQAAYDNSIAVKSVDAVTNSLTSAWNWMTGKPDVKATTVTTGSIDLNSTTKPVDNRVTRSASDPTPVNSQAPVDNRMTRSASDPGQEPQFGLDINGKPNRTKLAQTLDLQKNPKDANGVSRKATSPTTVTAELPTATQAKVTELKQNISAKAQEFLNQAPSVSTVEQQANDLSAQAKNTFSTKKPTSTSTSWFSGSLSK